MKNRQQKLRERELDEHRRIAKARGLIRKFDDPVLSLVCSPVEPSDDLRFLRMMRRACLATDTGVGLAASQIGITKCAVFIAPFRRVGEQFFMLNPEIIETSTEVEQGVEGCLSYPGYKAMVDRHVWIKVKYLRLSHPEYKQEPITGTYRNWVARIIEHECEHTRGKCVLRNVWLESKGIHNDRTNTTGTCLGDRAGRECVDNQATEAPPLQD